ncbi:MAG: hypothetical protein HY046_01270 [Acidobacteria bacterium]|nr:hypothetical protein [Acidobacteriota bacterium]
MLAWRKTSVDSLKRNFGWPFLGSIVAGVVAYALGAREFYALICLLLSAFVTFTIASEFHRGAMVIRARGTSNYVSCVAQLTMRNTRRYGGYIVHFGMVMIFVGLAGAAFNQDRQEEMRPGSRMQLGPYTLVLQTFTSNPAQNYTAERASIEVLRNGQPMMMLYPERRFYPVNEETGTMVAIHSTLKEDLYLVYAGRGPESNVPVIHAYLNPLVKWIWLGGVVLVIGTGLALVPNRQLAISLRAVQEPVPAFGSGHAAIQTISATSSRTGD